MTSFGLPDFLIIGTQKGGTSSLHRYLAQHPDILPPTVKEVHFFDGGRTPEIDTFALGTDWYRGHFPEPAEGKLLFESTPRYLFGPECAGRIKSLLPEAKLIVLLREPAERAISHYFHNVRMGREPLRIEEAFEAEAERIATWQNDLMKIEAGHYSYKSRGMYAEQLRLYFSCFDRNSVMIIQSERFFADEAGILSLVLDFLAVSPTSRAVNFTRRNVGVNKAPVDAAVVAHLRNEFRDANEDLFNLIGQRYDSWG